MAVSIAEVHQALTAPGERFEMEEIDIGGIRTRVWKNAPPTLMAILELSRLHGDKTFLVYEDEHTSFAQHFAQAATLAHRLIDDYGVKKGDRVAIAMRNFPEWPVAFWGAAAAGAVVVPLNAWWTSPELRYGLEDSGSKVLVADAERAERLAGDIPELDLAGVIVARGEAHGFDDFADVVGTVDPDASLPEVALEPEDDATIFYTSGTTGRPKGALGTHRNICTNLMSALFGGARGILRDGGQLPDPAEAAALPQQSYLLSVPFFHATGCHSVLVVNSAMGGKLVLMYKWDPGRALELIERERVTGFGGVPAMVWQVLEHPDFAKRDVSSVQSVRYGGAPAAPELVRRIEETFPQRSAAGQGYGLTETSSITTTNSGADYLEHPDSVGLPVPVCDLKVVDETGAELPEGGLGELWIRGPNIVKGYWNRPEETATTFTEGWLHSGDIARIDQEGFVYIVDRAKDMLIRGGENVYCVEVEDALYEHPDVVDAAVIGIPHDVLGEEVGAIVQLRPGSVATSQELKDHVAERLAAFKVPTKIWASAEPLPRNPAGKILKRELREQVLASPTTPAEAQLAAL